MAVDLVIMALGNTPNPIIRDSEATIKTTKWGAISIGAKRSKKISLVDVYSGSDAARGGQRSGGGI